MLVREYLPSSIKVDLSSSAISSPSGNSPSGYSSVVSSQYCQNFLLHDYVYLSIFFYHCLKNSTDSFSECSLQLNPSIKNCLCFSLFLNKSISMLCISLLKLLRSNSFRVSRYISLFKNSFIVSILISIPYHHSF